MNHSEAEIRLTRLAHCAGCGAKVGAGTLAALLGSLPTPAERDASLLVGYDRSDDAAVYRVSEELALVQTVDFFPPIADDPYLFGRIAAANALSDIYAMGGEPKVALNLLCLPEGTEDAVVRELLRGGLDAVTEAGASLAGGHSIYGGGLLYGLSVTGFVHPDRVLTNAGARPGDAVLLTKALGTGIVTTAATAGLVEPELLSSVHRRMAALNRAARDMLARFPVHACTDVTGFSLLGHGCELAQASSVTLRLTMADIPYPPEALELAAMGFVPAGAYRNREHAEPFVRLSDSLSRAETDILFDPQTSGGLLAALPSEAADDCLAALRAAGTESALIGRVLPPEDVAIVVE